MGKKKKTKRQIYQSLNKKIDDLNKSLADDNLRSFFELIGNRKQVLWKNLVAGITRGIGIGMGVTIITAIIVIVLQKIVTLNIPIIGEYITDIVEIVDKNLR